MPSWMRWLRRRGESLFWVCLGYVCENDVLTRGDYSILCSEFAIRRITEPFVKEGEDLEEWVL